MRQMKRTIFGAIYIILILSFTGIYVLQNEETSVEGFPSLDPNSNDEVVVTEKVTSNSYPGAHDLRTYFRDSVSNPGYNDMYISHQDNEVDGICEDIASGEEEKCRRCGGELYKRADDNAETIKKRLDVYFSETMPVIEYYRKQDKLLEVDGEGSVEIITARILNALRKLEFIAK